MSDTYSGPVKVYGDDGILLSTGVAAFENDDEHGTWTGVLQVLRGTGIAGKALVVNIETAEGERGLAQLTPQADVGERATSTVTGLGTRPY